MVARRAVMAMVVGKFRIVGTCRLYESLYDSRRAFIKPWGICPRTIPAQLHRCFVSVSMADLVLRSEGHDLAAMDDGS